LTTTDFDLAARHGRLFWHISRSPHDREVIVFSHCACSRKDENSSCMSFVPRELLRRGAAMVRTAAVVPEQQHFILASLSPSRGQRWLAVAVLFALLLAFVITEGPLSTIQLGRIDAFVPISATAMFVTDSITALLLFAQFSILRSRALLAIASGYLYTALIVIPWMLTFPGVFTPGGLIGAGLQTTSWLYTLWHAGFAMFVIAYALLRDADPARRLWRGSAAAAILLSVAMTAAVVCAVAYGVTAGDARFSTRSCSARFLPNAGNARRG
jgi:hypothetical protein